MSDFSNYMEGNIANWLRGVQMPTPPTALYVALFSANPGEAGSLANEVTTTVRAAGRPVLTLGAHTDGVMTNSADADFGASAGTVTVTHFAIMDAASAGNVLMFKAFATAQQIQATNPVKFASGALTVTIA